MGENRIPTSQFISTQLPNGQFKSGPGSAAVASAVAANAGGPGNAGDAGEQKQLVEAPEEAEQVWNTAVGMVCQLNHPGVTKPEIAPPASGGS